MCVSIAFHPTKPNTSPSAGPVAPGGSAGPYSCPEQAQVSRMGVPPNSNRKYSDARSIGFCLFGFSGEIANTQNHSFMKSAIREIAKASRFALPQPEGAERLYTIRPEAMYLWF